MTTGTTTQAAALAAKPPGYTIRIEATVTCAYDLELSKAAAKAICAEWVDPNEKWEDQAESVLETAMESLLDEPITEQLLGGLPEAITTVIEGKKVILILSHPQVSVDLETPEVL
jgi:hypothetical protein